MKEDMQIEEYMSRLSFKKKRFGGYDEEDVLLKIKQLNDLYQKKIEVLEKQLVEKQPSNNEVKDEEEQKTTYDTQVAALNSLMASIEASKDEILQQTKANALREAEQIRREVLTLRRQKHALDDEISNTVKLVTSSLHEIMEKTDQLQKQTAGHE